MDGADSIMANAIEESGCGIESGKDDSRLSMESKKVDIVTSTYSG